MDQYSTLILIALMVVAFYFLIMRPQRKRQQAVAKTLRELTPGTRVMLGSGERRYEDAWRALAASRPDRISTTIGFD